MLDLPADPRLILDRLNGWSPAMAGMSPGAFANLKSRLRAAFQLAAARLSNPRARPALEGIWGDLQASLDIGSQRNLSRLLHFADRQGWTPNGIGDAHMERFAIHLRDEALVQNWDGVVRSTIRAWNRLTESGDHTGLARLTSPPIKRSPYWVDMAQWPAGLRADTESFLAHLVKPSAFTGRKVRSLKPTTVQQYRHVIATLVSAAVASGVALETMPRLADVVDLDRLNRALMFLYERAGGQVTKHIFTLAMRAQKIAEWCEVPEENQRRIAELFANVKAEAPPMRGMTKKNRRLLDKLDDPRFHDLVLMLPQLLFRRAREQAHNRWSPAMVRSALAIEILLTCSLRRENLVSLELDRSIRRIGDGKEASWIIEVTPEEVKNGEPLRFTLPASTVELLEIYLAEWRPKLCLAPTPWLFPAEDGGRVDPRSLAAAIQSHSRLILGQAITPHQFRHLSAETYLLNDPNGLFVVSQHLGHRDPNTTKTFYSRPKQRQATRHYQAQVLRTRTQAEIRIRRGSRRRLDPLVDDREDVL
ncbi:site-specific integrase [Labrys sp. (in: a-proteobacteria)]|uniref:site-specific integrase n=1 Tax=Labrys sp. (in: a-proteobacteria) TaxID=1917972 RepID=UPI0039E4F086